MDLHRPLAATLACLAFTSCAQTPTGSELESQRLALELRALIGPAACKSDAQCRTVPVGAKACGGPAGYLAWSTQGTDAGAVNALAQRQAEAQRRELESSGTRSNCALVVAPGVACIAERCQLTTAAAAR